MAGMALLLVFAVTQDGSGWTTSNRGDQQLTRPERAFGDQPTGRSGRVDLPDALPSGVREQTTPEASRSDLGWPEFEEALNGPVDRNAPSSDTYTGLRPAEGVDSPPRPPSFGPPPERGRIREWLDEGRDRQRDATAPFRSEFNQPAASDDPREMNRTPRGRQLRADDELMEVPELGPDRAREPDLLYEERLADNRDDRRYLVPPSREDDDGRAGVTPVPFTHRDETARGNQAINDLPSVDLPLNSPNNFTDEGPTAKQPTGGPPSPSDGTQQGRDQQAESPAALGDQADSAEPERGWWPLMWALVGLFGSVGFNLYLGWIAWDIHGRYQDVVDEVRELENRLDQHQPRTESSDSHRIRA